MIKGERGRGRGKERPGKDLIRAGLDKGIYYRKGGRGLPNFSDYNVMFLYLAEKSHCSPLRTMPAASFFPEKICGLSRGDFLEATSVMSVVRVLILITFV